MSLNEFTALDFANAKALGYFNSNQLSNAAASMATTTQSPTPIAPAGPHSNMMPVPRPELTNNGVPAPRIPDMLYQDQALVAQTPTVVKTDVTHSSAMNLGPPPIQPKPVTPPHPNNLMPNHMMGTPGAATPSLPPRIPMYDYRAMPAGSAMNTPTQQSVASTPGTARYPYAADTPLMNSAKMRKRKPEFDTPSPGNDANNDPKRKRISAPPSASRSNSTSGDKGSKGLRHFSMKVCQKVQQKGVTTYTEVADELVLEFTAPDRTVSPADGFEGYDQKNIRRRVYDALNVLMAMNIISKEKKEIRWIGLPTNSLQECDLMEEDKRKRMARIQKKKSHIQELILQQISFKNLVNYNKAAANRPDPKNPLKCLQLPFIIVNTKADTGIDCEMTANRTEFLFNFTQPFEIHDDIEVLKRMRMAFGLEHGRGCADEEKKKAKELLPPSIH
eukprot:Colp12_sorted_trinity150504_noHs@1666